MFSKKILGIVLLVAASAAFVGCTDNSLGFTENQIAYKTNFEAAFGKIDPNQDWNAATRASVTVNVSGESDVQIFALNGGSYKLVGDYSKVSGTQTLGVDVVKGTEKLLVSDGSTTQITTLGGNVSFGMKTRAGNYGSYTDGFGNTMSVSATDKYKVFDQAEVKAWDAILPEIADVGNDGLAKIVEKQLDNLKNVTADCSFVSNGPFYIYPLYYRTGAIDIVGTYVEEDSKVDNNTVTITKEQALDGKQHYVSQADIYTIKSGEELQYGIYAWKTFANDPNLPENAREYDAVANGYVLKSEGNDPVKNGYIPAVYAEVGEWVYNESKNENDWVVTGYTYQSPAKYVDYQWIDVSSPESSEKHFEADYGNAVLMRSRAIKVDIPVGQRFGFYIKNGPATFYSQSNLNPDMAYVFGYDNGKISYSKTKQTGEARACHVSTFELDGKTYLGFEDWSNNNVKTGGEGKSDEDLNDVMFLLDGAVPTPLNEDSKSSSWVLACEDLGGSFDGDYNDVVFSVEHISGRNYANVTPLAAGGTLASYLYFGTRQLGEIHSLLGGSAAESGSYAPINVGESRGSAGQQLRVEVGNDFTMAYSETGSSEFSESEASNMGGFYVKVAPKGSTGDTELGDKSVIAAPGIGEVPAIFCIPATYTVENYPETGKKTEYYWAWAQELNSLISINNDQYGSGAYPDFAGWVADHTENTDWYKYPSANGKIVSERKTVSDMPTSGGNSGEQGSEPENGSEDVVAIQDGFTIAEEPTSNINFGSAYLVTVDATKIDLSIGGKITVVWTDDPGSGKQSFIADENGSQVDAANTSSSKSELTISPNKLTTKFYVGTWGTISAIKELKFE